MYNKLSKMWRNRLRLNTMSKEVELDGQKLTPDYLYLDLLNYGICSSKDFVIDCFRVFRKYNAGIYCLSQNYRDFLSDPELADSLMPNTTSNAR